MARKAMQYQVQDSGRDQGKVFILREMPASQAEKWAVRAFLAMASNGIELPEGVEHTGFAGIAQVGLSMIGKLPFAEAEPLLDEMMGCVTYMPNPSNPSVSRALIEDDIEEVATRLKLRVAVFKLHADFSFAGALSTSAPASAATGHTAPSTT